MERQGHGGWKKVPEESEGTAHGVMVGGGREGVEAGPPFPCAGRGAGFLPENGCACCGEGCQRKASQLLRVAQGSAEAGIMALCHCRGGLTRDACGTQWCWAPRRGRRPHRNGGARGPVEPVGPVVPEGPVVPVGPVVRRTVAPAAYFRLGGMGVAVAGQGNEQTGVEGERIETNRQV